MFLLCQILCPQNVDIPTAHLAKPGCLSLSRHCEPVQANSWSLARSSQEGSDHPYQQVVWATQVPPGTQLVYIGEMAIEFAPHTTWRQRKNNYTKSCLHWGMGTTLQVRNPSLNHYTTRTHRQRERGERGRRWPGAYIQIVSASYHYFQFQCVVLCSQLSLEGRP